MPNKECSTSKNAAVWSEGEESEGEDGGRGCRPVVGP